MGSNSPDIANLPSRSFLAWSPLGEPCRGLVADPGLCVPLGAKGADVQDRCVGAVVHANAEGAVFGHRCRKRRLDQVRISHKDTMDCAATGCKIMLLLLH